MNGNTGSTIQARAEVGSHLFTILFIVAVIVFALLAVYFISKAITKYHNSPAYLEKKKKRPTSVKDINEIAQICALVKEEKDLLFHFCKEVSTPNIMYLVKDREALDSHLKDLYKKLSTINDNENISNLFSLRKKIFMVFKQKVIVKNSKLIDVGTDFTYTVSKGFHYKLNLKENNPDGMVLDVPSTINVETDMPKPLEKISLVFEVKDGAPYTLDSRIVRYQKGKDGSQQVILVHSDKIAGLQQRGQERADMNCPCKFSSVKVSIEGTGKKEKVVYVPAEKEYDGKLEDISTGGCRLSTYLPIKADQNIYIKGTFNNKQVDNAVGVIVRTTKRADNVFVLHIRFVKIDSPVVNRINAMVTHYDA
ncbi:MAG: PilZ domain-containing protein [Treponema sp.]|nr:PilZ domain-containing protein [Candidatus Treponema equifaecale]